MGTSGLQQPVIAGITTSTGNSTTTPLGASATFTGATENVSDFTAISLNVAGAPANAPGALFFEFSPDGTNWDVSIQVSGADLTGPTAIPIHLRIVLPWFRVRYSNRATPQTQFRLTTVYHRGGASRLTRFLNQTLDATEGLESVRAAVYGQAVAGSFAPLRIGAGNEVRVDPTGTTTQPVSMATLPLPAGAATEVTLGDIEADIDTLVTQQTDGTQQTQVNAGVDRTTTGSITNTQNAAINTQGCGTCGFTITGTWAGSLTFEVSVDGVIWSGTYAINTFLGTFSSGSFNLNGSWVVPVAGYQQFRIRGASVTSGTANITLNASIGTQIVAMIAPIRISSGTVTANIGTPGALALDASLAPLLTESTFLTRFTGPAATEATLATLATETTLSAVRSAVSTAVVHQTDGNQRTQILGGAKGTTNPADVTTTDEGADHQALDVQLYHGWAAIDPRSIRALTNADVVKAQLQDNAGTAITLGQKTMAGSVPVVLASDESALPISAAALPLPSGAATLAEQQTQTTALQLIDNLPHAMNAAFNNAAAVAGQLDDAATTAATEDNVAPVRITAQRGLHANLRNVAGTEIATAGAPLRVDPTGLTTQPVSGTVTANIGTTGGLALDATLTGGTQQAIVRGGAKGATVAATLTSTAEGVDHQALDVAAYFGGAAIDPRSIRALTNTDVVKAQLQDNAGTAITLGQKVMASSIPVVLASDESTLPISAASLPLPTGASTLAEQQTQTTALQLIDNLPHGMNAAFNNAVPAAGQLDDVGTTAATENNIAPVRITAQRALHTNLRDNAGTELATAGAPLRTDPTGTTAQPVTDNAGSLTVDSAQLPAALVGGRLDENVGAWLGSTAPTVGSKASANSIPVVIASDQSVVAISAASLPLPTGAATQATLSAVLTDLDSISLTQTDGLQTTIVRGGIKGDTLAANITSTAAGLSHQALDVQLYNNGVPVGPDEEDSLAENQNERIISLLELILDTLTGDDD